MWLTVLALNSPLDVDDHTTMEEIIQHFDNLGVSYTACFDREYKRYYDAHVRDVCMHCSCC